MVEEKFISSSPQNILYAIPTDAKIDKCVPKKSFHKLL